MISPLICLASSILNSVLPDAVGPTITTKNGLLMSLNSYPHFIFSLTLVLDPFKHMTPNHFFSSSNKISCLLFA